MEYLGGTWSNNGFGDRGWLAIALVILALWNPSNAIWGSLVFGALYILYIYMPGLTRATQELCQDASLRGNDRGIDPYQQAQQAGEPAACKLR